MTSQNASKLAPTQPRQEADLQHRVAHVWQTLAAYCPNRLRPGMRMADLPTTTLAVVLQYVDDGDERRLKEALLHG